MLKALYYLTKKENKLENPVCRKVISMLSMFIEHKLCESDMLFIENHFYKCQSCYQKYLEMKEIINNLHFEYEKLLSEFDSIENNKLFNIREYETFYNNISPYIDDELCYDESIKFRKYLLKSKPARSELSNAYLLRNNIKSSVDSYKNGLNFNYSKKIINTIKNENKIPYAFFFGKTALVTSLTVFSILVLFIYFLLSHFNESYADDIDLENGHVIDTLAFPADEEDFVEFSFDGNHEALLSDK